MQQYSKGQFLFRRYKYFFLNWKNNNLSKLFIFRNTGAKLQFSETKGTE